MYFDKENLVKYVLLTAAGTVVYLAVGWFVFDFILGAYTEANTTHIAGFKKEGEAFSTALLVVSCVAYAALMTFILAILTDTRSAMRGLLIGAITGVLVAVMADAYWLASSNFYGSVWVAVADVCGAAVSVGVLGLVTALLWRWMSKKML